MKEINIKEPKEFTPEPVDGTIRSVEPHEEDAWEIIVNGETITHSVSGAYCEPTEDTKEIIGLRDDVFSIVKEKNAYKALPEAKGGYE
ncbi:hypothetical protein GCM10008931_36990 [Oceanobacillus oncorhynchi subsp. oncorhynchi]|uniref:hypothetical protein n=1 Tax=Oceanobacillus oncorhynchi TaxID=545501 RepID=UPI0031CEC6B2